MARGKWLTKSHPVCESLSFCVHWIRGLCIEDSETTDYNKSREREATAHTLRGHWLISAVDTLLLVFAAFTHDASLPFCTDGDLVLWL